MPRRRAVRAAGGLVATAIGVAALARLWQVFPLDPGDATIDWGLWTRLALVVGLAGAAIGLLTHRGALVRAVADSAVPCQVFLMRRPRDTSN